MATKEWSEEEKENLIGELKASINMMARFHKRTEIQVAFKLSDWWEEADLYNPKTWGKEE